MEQKAVKKHKKLQKNSEDINDNDKTLWIAEHRYDKKAWENKICSAMHYYYTLESVFIQCYHFILLLWVMLSCCYNSWWCVWLQLCRILDTRFRFYFHIVILCANKTYKTTRAIVNESRFFRFFRIPLGIL